jgi:hypothetical protein
MARSNGALSVEGVLAASAGIEKSKDVLSTIV